MLNPADLAEILRAHPYPGVTDLVIEDGDLNLTFEGATVPLDGELWRLDGVGVRFDVDGWNTCGLTVRSHLSAAPTPDAVHAEIALVLRLAAKTPESPARRDRRLTDEMDRRRDMEQALAKVTTERNALLVAESTLSKIAAALAIPALEPHDDALSMVRRLVDGYTVVSQRLVGSQKEVAERDTTIDELRSALEVIAGHVGADGSDQWAVEVIKAKVGEVAARADKVEDRLRRDDKLREQIAVAVGLDGSASLALILDTVTRDRPGREISRLSGLLDVFAAPVIFGERRLSTVERAEWALRRALRDRDECAPRMAQLIDAEVCLDTLGVPAYATVPGDDPGDASEALTVAERLRLYFGAHKDP